MTPDETRPSGTGWPARGARCGAAAASLAAALIAAAGCGRAKESPEAYAARVAIERYDAALVEAFRTSRADRLADVASAAEVSRNEGVIAGLARQGLYMEARQTELRIEGTAASPAGGVDVNAVESWVYEHRSAADRGRAAPQKRVQYRLTYRLEKTPRGLRVDQVVERDAPDHAGDHG
jgi:hypothetical protein